VIVGGEAELLLLLHLFPEGVEELDGAFAVYADEPPIGFDVVEAGDVREGWEDSWREFHYGVAVGRFWVGPPWEDPPPGLEPIVVDPGRAFGTGAHPTTRLSLELLQGIEPGSFLDIGCGSGVLSIGAAKLGFAPVTGVDLDEPAIEVTNANAHVNGVVVEAYVADALTDALPRTEVAVANVALDVVEALAPRVGARFFVTSGYLDRDEPELAGWDRVERRTADGWAADLFERIDRRSARISEGGVELRPWKDGDSATWGAADAFGPVDED
jgi:ribosomal protein L11 methyltransferase